MTLDPEAHYLQLQALVAEMPELGGIAPITNEMNLWLGRAAQLVSAPETTNSMIDGVTLRTCADRP
jgi:hypothetical protein